MQPYQEASEEIRRQANLPGNLLKKGAAIGASLYGGGAILKRVAPLLSPLIPSGLAAKGLEKVDPRFGKFIKSAVANGSSLDDILNFIKEKTSGESLSKEESLRKFKDHQKKKGLAEGLQDDLDKEYGKPKKKDIYEEMFNALSNGVTSLGDETVDPILQKIMPYFQKGFIKQPEDIKQFMNSLFSKKSTPENQSQMQQQGQGQAALMQAIQQLQQIRGQSK